MLKLLKVCVRRQQFLLDVTFEDVRDFKKLNDELNDITGVIETSIFTKEVPNIERGIDTSGVLILDYETFKCVCVGAKDCKAPIANNIQGDKGCIYQDTPANVCERFELLMNDGTSSLINENNYNHRMVNEFIEFIEMIKNNNLEKCYKMLEHSLIVSEVQTIARNKSGIVFPDDNDIE